MEPCGVIMVAGRRGFLASLEGWAGIDEGWVGDEAEVLRGILEEDASTFGGQLAAEGSVCTNKLDIVVTSLGEKDWRKQTLIGSYNSRF